MARWTNFVDRNVKSLIKDVTGFQENEENFSLCLNFVQSNLKYHRFLTPDSHKLNRSVAGLIEKFQIHCQQDKANSLRKLVDAFLDFPIDGEQKQSETHYALLSLLLHLSSSPLAADYTPSEQRIEKDAVDQFDWTSYLLEGFGDYSWPKCDDESMWTDEDEEEESVASPHMLLQEVRDRTLCNTQEDSPDVRLREKTVARFWAGQLDHSGSSHESSTLRSDWEEFQRHTNEMHAVRERSLVSEYHVMRELIWMLCGAKSSFIFHWDGVQFIANPEIMVSHLTDTALNNLLRNITRYGTIVQHLQRFIQRVVDRERAFSSLTMQTLAEALSCHLQQLKTKLIPVEKRICAQTECHTIVNLLDLLTPDLRDLEQVNRLLTDGISDRDMSMAERSVLLLTQTNVLLMQAHLSDTAARQSLMFNIWIRILRPYLEIIDNWITYGKYEDFHNEFIIRRNQDSSSLDEHFWSKACSVEGNSKAIPDFLRAVFHEIILAGKSVELLQNLGHLDQVIKTTKSERRPPLYDLFVQSVSEELGQEVSQSDGSAGITVERSPIVLLEADGFRDHFLSTNFANIFTEDRNISLRSADDELLLRRLQCLHGVPPPNLLLERCLHPHISHQYSIVCKALLNTLKEEYQLMQHFSVMRKVYLMEAGDMMYDFYTAIFEKMRLKESWSDVSFLNICLQGALQHCLSDDLAASLFVDVDETQGNSLKALRIRYNVRFPVNIVINTDSVDTYSQTFAFLMQIKYAKYSIDTLSFSELAERSCDHNSALVHRMHMLRMRLMHFINGLHQYIMTRILHSTAMEFQRDVQSARDLQDVLVSHQRYLTRIHDRCLLHQRAQFIHQIVIKILNMALVFAGSWQQGITTVSLKSLKSLEEEFSKCLQFLSSFLNNYMKRGSFPHRENASVLLIFLLF